MKMALVYLMFYGKTGSVKFKLHAYYDDDFIITAIVLF